MPPSNLDIVRSYRLLHRQALRAIQYGSPARHTLRKVVNNAYRSGTRDDYDLKKINNTITFLECATKEKGLEHRILKSLMHTWYFGGFTRQRKPGQKPLEEEEMVLMQSAFHHFTMTLKMLNETMAMCLPTSPEAVHWDPLPKYEMD